MANKKDFATGVVSSLSGTTLTFQTGYGQTMPTPPFYLTLSPPGQLTTLGNSEKVLVTSKTSAEVFECTRAQGDTTSKTVVSGWIAVNSIYTDDLLTSSMTMGEVLTGTPNGVLTAFTTASAFTLIEVFKNGVRLRGGAGNDYTTSGQTITFTTAPATGAVLLANYILGSQLMITGSNSLITKEAAVGTVNGSNTSFSVSKGSYIAGSLQLYINGLRQGIANVTETSPTTGTFALDTAPLTGDNVEVGYQYVLSVSGNADTVDSYHASATATANQILPLDANARMDASVITNPYMFSAYCSTGKAANTTSVAVDFQTELFDPNSNFASSRYTAPVSGYYQVNAQVWWGPAGTGPTENCVIRLYKNSSGTGMPESMWMNGSGDAYRLLKPQIHSLIQLTAGDYIEVIIQTTGTRDIVAGAANTFFNGFLVSKA